MAGKRRRRGRRGRKKGNWFSRLSLGKKIGVCTAGILCASLAGVVVVIAAKLGKIDTQEIAAEDIIINEEVAENKGDLGEGFTNVALFGVDSREGDLEQGTRTDCIIVASLNNETKEIKMVSVYRDTLLDLSEGTLQKCNAAYSFGGPTQAINMLNMNLDLDIQKYVTVDFSVVAEVVDLLGGVEIDLKPEEVQYLNEFIDETGAVAGKEAHHVSESGVQLMDGVQATTYARIRSTAGGDFTRTERQRLVIEKMVEKVKQSDLGTINSIIDKVFPTISTNFTTTEIITYASFFADYVLGENTGFPIDKATDTISGLGSIVIPADLADNVKQLHEFLFGDPNYSPSGKVQSISSAIISRVGQRQAESDEVLNSQTYEEDPQEAPGYNYNQNNWDNNGNQSGGGNNQNPINPVEPVNPVDPTPVDPVKPVEPVEPNQPGDGDSGSGENTGDGGNPENSP